MKKQLIICSDMEGASGIFDNDINQVRHGSNDWRELGRANMTSDVLAVCEAANEFGIDEIIIYDGHYAGSAEFNILKEKMPENVRFFDTENRCFDWRRIRGQADQNPFGIITVGQHSRYGEDNAYFPHTVQSPPLKAFWCNDLHLAEIGSAVASFQGVKYLANIGCKASMKEAKELSDTVVEIPVKDKSKNWEPDSNETFSIIKNGVTKALNNWETAKAFEMEGSCKMSLELTDGYYFDAPTEFPWKGDFKKDVAYWEAVSIEVGLELFNCVRSCVKKLI